MVSKTFTGGAPYDGANLDTNFDELQAQADENATKIDTASASIADLQATRMTRAQVLQIIAETSTGTGVQVTTSPAIRVQGGGGAIPTAVLEIGTAAAFSGSPDHYVEEWFATNGTLSNATSGSTYTIHADDSTAGLVIGYRKRAEDVSNNVLATAVSTNYITAINTPSVVLVNTVAPAYTAGVTAAAATAVDFNATNTTRYATYSGAAITSNVFSIGFWRRSSRTRAATEVAFSFGGNPASTGGLEWACGATSDARIYGRLNGGSNSFYYQSGTWTATDGVDRLHVLTCDGTTLRGYVLAEGDSTATPYGTPVTTSAVGGTGFAAATREVGREGYTAGSWDTEPIGEVFEMHGYCLSAAQIVQLASGMSPVELGVGTVQYYWPMRATSETTNQGSAGGTMTWNGSGYGSVTSFWATASNGTADAGDTVTVDNGTWTLDGAGVTPQTITVSWKREGVQVGTTSSYAIPATETNGAEYHAEVTADYTGALGTASAPSFYVTAGGAGETAITASDVKIHMNANNTWASHSTPNIRAHVVGTNIQVTTINESTGVTYSGTPSGTSLRLGKVADPADAAKKAFFFNLIGTDPLSPPGASAGSRRVQFVVGNSELPIYNGQTWWTTYSFMIPTGADMTRDHLIGFQLHCTDYTNTAKLLNPIIVWYTYGDTATLYTHARTTNEVNTSKNVVNSHYTMSIARDTWYDVVEQWKPTATAVSNPFLKVWVNGVQVVNATPLIGVPDASQPTNNWQYGYNWSHSNYWWEDPYPSSGSSIYFKACALIRDNSYTFSQINNWFQAAKG